MPGHTAFLHLMVSLSAYVRVSSGLALALGELVCLRELKRGGVLVEQGKSQQVVWFVHMGTAKEVSACDNLLGSRVSWFWSASDFVFSYPGFFAREPAVASIELVEDSVLLEIAYADLMGLKEEFEEVGLLVEKIRAGHEKLRAAHAMDLVNLNARERYRKFFEGNKRLFNVAKHKDIAGFLGIRDDGFHRYQ